MKSEQLELQIRSEFSLKLQKNKNGTESYSFSSDNYNAGVCGSGHNLSTDIHQGDPTYDAARANMGGTPWVMFNKDQGQELIDNTTKEWITINNINGIKFINKTDDSKYIFIPRGGYWYDMTHSSINSLAFYWSTTWSPYPNCCYHLVFGSSTVSITDYPGYSNRNGMSIRGIVSPKQW